MQAVDAYGDGAGLGMVVDVDVVRAYEPAVQPGDRSEELHHELVGRPVVEIVGPAHLLDLPVVDHHQLVGDLEGLFLIMGDEHGRHVDLVVQPPQPVAQFLADLGIQRAERLVQQQHLRLRGECPGQRHPLPLTAGELGREPVGELIEMDQFQQLVHPLAHLRLGSLADL